MGIEKTIGSKNYPTKFECKKFKGSKYLDLRNYYLDENEELKPTKKGITLNKTKFQEFIEFINENNKEISDFFEENQSDLKVKLEFQTLIGRNFHISYENGQTVVFLNENLKKKYNDKEILLLQKLLLIFHQSLLDVLDYNDFKNEIESILNFVSHKINRNEQPY